MVHYIRPLLADARNWCVFITNYPASYNYQLVHHKLYSRLSLCMVPCTRLPMPNQRHSERSKPQLLFKSFIRRLRSVCGLQQFQFLAEHVPLLIHDFVHSVILALHEHANALTLAQMDASDKRRYRYVGAHRRHAAQAYLQRQRRVLPRVGPQRLRLCLL